MINSLLESTELSPNNKAKLRASTDAVSSNRFKTRAKGIVIEDTVNNPVFPIPLPILDDNNNNLNLVIDQFYAIYGKMELNSSLPWHYIIEFFNGSYNIYQTKPIDQAYPFTNKIVKDIIADNNVNITVETKDFLANTVDKRECVHILIIGDSFKDVYTKQLYKLIGEFIIAPTSRLNKFSPLNNTYTINLGSKFKKEILQNYVRG